MANNISIKNSAGTDTTVKTTDNASVHTPHHNVDTCTTVSTVSSVTAVAGTVTVAGTGTFVTQSVVTNAGTFAVQAAQSGTWNITTCSTVTTLTTLTGSGVAHDGVDSGNPHKIGAKATAALSGATLVSAADRTDLHAGVDGVLIVRPHCNLEDIVSGTASNTDGTSTPCIAAAGSGIKIYLQSVTLSNTSSTAVEVALKSGSTEMWTYPVPANTSGVVCNFPIPLPPNAANEAWNFDPSTSATTIKCSMLGFKSKV
jgi:hypothetical protein